MHTIIPKPAFYEEKLGEFIISEDVSVYADLELVHCRDALIDVVEKACNYKLNSVISKKAAIRFLYDNHEPREGYRIEATSEGVDIFASSYAGGFYAVQTLRRLTGADVIDGTSVLTMHAVSIKDKPRYEWRGLLLDESRNFFGADTVKRLLDLMAIHKLNVLHWHLTDNLGWRIEIKKYPKLTEIGAHRKGTQNVAWGRPDLVDWTPVEGYYTKEEIKDIVTYAGKRNIVIVPELDMPAHFAAALAAYPELSCTGKVIETPVRYSGELSDFGLLACAGKASTYKFIYDVIDEMCEMFPAPFFHIGGDEAPKKEWKKCPDCQKVIADNGLKDEEDLQGYFNNKIALYLKAKGKRLIGWNEILMSDKLDSSVVAQYWVPARDKRTEKHAADGRDIIISKHQAFYFDMPYAMRNLKTTYEFEPEDINLRDSDGGIMGVEGAIWTEWIQRRERLDFQLFPRMEALAEVAWSKKEHRNYSDFKSRLKDFLVVLDKMGVTYAPLSMVDKKGLGAKRISVKYHVSDAHCEYKKAVKKAKRTR